MVIICCSKVCRLIWLLRFLKYSLLRIRYVQGLCFTYKHSRVLYQLLSNFICNILSLKSILVCYITYSLSAEPRIPAPETKFSLPYITQRETCHNIWVNEWAKIGRKREEKGVMMSNFYGCTSSRTLHCCVYMICRYAELQQLSLLKYYFLKTFKRKKYSKVKWSYIISLRAPAAHHERKQ